MTVHGLERRVMSGLTQNNTNIAVTPWTRAAEVFGHGKH